MFDGAIQVDGFVPRLVLAQEAANTSKDFAGAPRLLDHMSHCVPQLAVLVVVSVQPIQAPPREAGDGGKRLVHLVGDAGGELAHYAYPGDVREFRLVLSGQLLRASPLGHFVFQFGVGVR